MRPANNGILLRRARRAVFALLVLATIASASGRMADLVAKNGFTPLECAIFALFVVLMLPVAFSFWLAIFGFAVRLRGHDPLSPVRALSGAPREIPLEVRTAIAVPVHNEDPVRVAAGVRATFASLQATGQADRFTFFLLSDTTDPDVWVEEEVVYDALRQDLPRSDCLVYRRRRHNTEAKAGNIAEFCATYGDQYRYMVVFDADSVMSGACIVNLVRLMEQHPEAGIIQAPPLPVNRQTLFGRLQQFAARAYGPLFQAGLSSLQGGDGNYYGHNAILRIQPFSEHCRLPHLSGTGPLSGHILSHDFVEAAFMRRAGYRVYLARELAGSYEEPPPTLIDFAARDRRWCQGNLQHARLLFTRGFNVVSRIHLFMGIMAYVSSPLWLLLLFASTVEAVRVELTRHQYFDPSGSLFPTWRIDTQDETALLFAGVMGLLFVPKLLALLAILLRDGEAERFGGGLRMLASGLLESVFSMLIAPVLAFLQSRFVLLTLLGRRVTWGAQERNDVGTPLALAARRHAGLTVIGLVWGAAAWEFVPSLFWWLSPVVAGLVFSIPLSVWSSRASAGQRARAAGLFVTPEERELPFVLARLRAELMRSATSAERAGPADGLQRVLSDPAVRLLHLSLLPAESPPVATDARETALREHRLRGLELKYRLAGSAGLDAAERRELLASRRSIETLSGLAA